MDPSSFGLNPDLPLFHSSIMTDSPLLRFTKSFGAASLLQGTRNLLVDAAQAGERLDESPLLLLRVECDSHLTISEVTWSTCNRYELRLMALRRLPVSLIVACSVNRVIGKQGRLPWNLPADWSFFSSATRHQVLVVGRRSFEEFDEPIPNRHTIVVSSTLKQPMQTAVEAVGGRWSGVQVAQTLEEALQLANSHPLYQDCTRVFIGGGERLYKEAMAAQVAESCYVTRVQQYIADGDTHFPNWTAQFPNLVYSAKTSGGGDTRVSFEIWGSGRS